MSRQQSESEKMLEVRKQLREDLQYLNSSYGIRPEMRRRTKTDEADIIHIEKLNLLEAAEALRTVRRELAKYPQEYLQFCALERLRLVKTLQTQEKDLQGEALHTGRAYHEDRILYLATSGEGLYSLKGTLHHELFHLSDSAQIQRNIQMNIYHFSTRRSAHLIYQRMYDHEWEKLNPQEKKAYVGQAYFTHPLKENEKDLEGFALPSGTIDPWEDRATIAGLLLTDPKATLEKAQRDTVFCAKLERIMAFYKERSRGKMDESYFTDLAAGKVIEGYWKKISL